MKPVLLVDFDGTLCHDRFWRSADSDLNKKIQDYLFGADKKIVNDWMRGTHTSEDVNLMLSKKLGIDYEKLWGIFVQECKTMFIEEEVLNNINRLRERYKTVLTTDNMDCLNRFTVPALGLDRYFDEVVNSYYEKKSKNDNDGELLKLVIERSEGELKNSILIDNSMSTCKLFEKLGGRSLLVTKEYPLVYWLDKLIA